MGTNSVVRLPENIANNSYQNILQAEREQGAIGRGVDALLQNKTSMSNAEKFFKDEAGQQFVENVKFLRKTYEMSKLQGADKATIKAWIKDYLKRTEPEEFARIGTANDDDVSKAWLQNKSNILVNQMKKIWKNYPDLATSNKYVIIADEEGQPRYVTKDSLSDEDKQLVFPQSTGQYIQQVANAYSAMGFPLHASDMYTELYRQMGGFEGGNYPSKASNDPFWDAVLQPRSGNMANDDELQSKLGNYDEAFRGDALELASNFVNPFWLLKAPRVALTTAYRMGKAGVAMANLARKAPKLGQLGVKAGNLINKAEDKIGTGIDTMKKVETVAGLPFESNAYARAIRGAGTNVAQTLATDIGGQAYDKVYGTDRGESIINGADGVQWLPLAIDALTGVVSKAIQNPADAQKAYQDLWKQMNETDWGVKYKEAMAQAGKPIHDISDLDLQTMSQFITGQPLETFARKVYKGHDFPKVHLDPSAHPIENRNARIDRANALIEEKNKGIRAENKAMDENYNEVVKQNNEVADQIYGADQPDIASASDKLDEANSAVEKQEQNVANLEQKIANEKQQKMAEDWNKLNYYGPEGGNAERTANSTQLSQPHYQQPYAEHQPKFVAKQDIKLKDGSTLRVGELDGKPATQRVNADGSVGKVVPISNKEAVGMNGSLKEENQFADASTTRNIDTSKKGKIGTYIPEEPKQLDNVQDIANKGRMQNAVEVLGQRKEALNKATADYNSAVEESLKPQQKGWMSKEEYQLRNPEAPQHKPQIPTLEKLDLEVDKIKNGELTPGFKWYCQRMYKTFGFSSPKEMEIKMPMKDRVKLAQSIEATANDEGWQTGVGSGMEFTLPEWQHIKNQHAPKAQQSQLTQEELYANNTDAYKHDLMTDFMKFPEGTPQSKYDELAKANAEYRARMLKGMGHFKIPEATVKGMARDGLGYGLGFLGREGTSTDYDYESWNPADWRIPVEKSRDLKH